jgi:unsaturated rhamnogalacturonyl hydrolase
MKQFIFGSAAALFALSAFCAPMDTTKAGDVLAMMVKVADWQLANPSKHPAQDWTMGALYPGYLALDGIQADPRYRNAVKAVGDSVKWQDGPRVYHADDLTVSQAFCEMYALWRDPAMLAPTRARFDTLIDKPATCPVDQITWCKKGQLATPMRWWWCDALFMAPPAFARLWDMTDDGRYLDFMVKEWKATAGALYDPEEHLFFRDNGYFPQKKREANGKKIFWGRGNGWVLGGLVRVLEVLPADHPDRPYFEKQFQDMTRKMISIQPADGVWRASLLDPDSYPIPETSGTVFICYALGWGINHGLLTAAEAEAPLRKAYGTLMSFVTPEGKLTHVQPVGADPKKFAEDATEVYGVGAFLMAGAELYRMDLLRDAPHATFTVKNQSAAFLPERTVEIPWASVVAKLPAAKPETIAVLDERTSRFLVTQLITGADGKPSLLFQTGLHAKQAKTFILVSGLDRSKLPVSVRSTFARYVPERLDDFAWENDRTAWRAYGPALWKQDGPTKTGSGVDVWGKNDRLPVVNRMFKEKSYHAADLGYGIDCYKVGTGPGCGGIAAVRNGEYIQPTCYEKWSLGENGPIRSTFRLTYAGNITRDFTIDLGSDFFKILNNWPSAVMPAAGCTSRPAKPGDAAEGPGWCAAWENGDGVPCFNGVAIVVPGGSKPITRGETKWITGTSSAGMTFWAGSCWSSGKDYHSAKDWFAAVERFRAGLEAVVTVQ